MSTTLPCPPSLKLDPRCRRGPSSYISRLQCVQTAVHAQLEELEKTQPDCVVVLVTFCSDVEVVGDGTVVSKKFNGALLNRSSALVEKGKEIARLYQTPIKNSKNQLVNLLYRLEPTSATALGPALSIAVGITASRPGSKVMLCTDGMANVGCGSIEQGKDITFYPDIGSQAKKLSTSVSIITMEGEDCSMENLGTVADYTGGGVEIVDPLNLTSKVVSLLKKSILATSLVCTLVTNEHYAVFNDEEALQPRAKVTREMGSIAEDVDTTISFKPTEHLKRLIKDDLEDDSSERMAPSAVPFQIQLQYVNAKGDRVLQVITSAKPITTDRSMAEKKMDSVAVSLQAIHSSARLAHSGKYHDARVNLISTVRLLQRAMETTQHQKDYLNFIVQSEKLDQFMREAQVLEKVLGEKAATERKYDRDDDSAKAIFQMKGVSVRSFLNRC